MAFQLDESASDSQIHESHERIALEINALLYLHSFILIRDTIWSVMEGFMNADLLNPETGFRAGA
jgi:hypothetical protein